MPRIEIRTPDGRAEVRKLSRRNPIVVGRNPISDVHVEDESVAPIHCRVSWNGKAFEVAAVAADGIDVNGVLVRRKELAAGDVIRVGEIDLVLLNGSDEALKAASAAGVGGAAGPRASGAGRGRAGVDDAPAELADEDWAALSAGEIEVVEPPSKAAGPKARAEKAEARRDEAAADDEPVLLDETAAPGRPEPRPKPAPAPMAGVMGRLRQTKRPGEQDILTSPLVLGFGGLALLLLLAAATFWLLIDREGANRLYAAAVADREAGRYAQAILNYEQFLRDYGDDGRAAEARYALGLTRIERYAGGSSPDFDKALQAFDEFVRTFRDAPGFDSQKEPLRELARRIASGASAAAVRTGDRKFLAPAEEGRRLFDRYAMSDDSAAEVRDALAAEFAAAEAAVRKREYFDAAAAKIEEAVAKNDFPTAFGARTDLLTRYPDLESDKRVQTLLAKTLAAEKSLVKPLDRGEPASPSATSVADQGADAPRSPVTLVGHTQARAGEVSDGRLVFAVARDALVGLDAVTGRPRWRTPIGLDTPFFPVEVDASVPALLAFDASRDELVLLRREDGAPLWRTPVGSAATGPPLVAQGQIDLATADGRLVRFALESGDLLAAVAFPQPVVGPPVPAGEGERLVLFGDQATAYTLDLRSLEVQAVSFTGHAAGALDVPPQALGRLVVVCENDRLDSAAVRAFSVEADTGTLRQVASERIQGQVRRPPVARGNLLFVPSMPERITAFSVSDDAGQPPLTRLAGIQIPEAKEVPTYLVPGPDGMLWAAGSALRKLKLVADGLELMQGTLAPGRHTQPPQESGESLFVARSLPSAPAVYVSQADREAMTGSWRTVLGAAIVALATDERGVTTVNEAGQAAVLAAADLEKGGFVDARPLPQWDEESPEPLRGASLGDGRAAVWRGGASPLMWLIPAGGQPGPPRSLAAPLEGPPAALDDGLVLPLPGRLEWLPESGAAGQVQAFLLPVAGEGQAAPKWRSLVRLDGERVVATDDAGTVRVIRLRTEPLPHLAEVAAVTLDAPPAGPPAVVGDRIAVAVRGRVQLLDPSGLRPVAEAAAEPPVAGGPWAAGDALFADAGSGRLLALDAGSLAERWRVALDGPVAAAPVRAADGWLVASQAGTVLVLNDDGTERGRVTLGTPLTGLHPAAGTALAASLDGSLYPVSAEDAARSADATTAEPQEAAE